MDKYEFNIKVEQIKKLVTKGDFTTSMKIADTIDWRRVRNVNLLSMISQVYEKNGEYQEAKEILMQAYERAPAGKRLLFKLTELSLREGNVKDAEEYYREFCKAAQGDARQNLLRYLILKAKGAPSRQQIAALEKYVETELDERWMYELAELYAEANDRDRCIQMCDKIALMFAFGKYVNKALELKKKYAALSDYQKDLVQNPGKYEAQYKAVEQEFANGALDVFGEEDRRSEQMQYPDGSFEMQYPDNEYAEENGYPQYPGEQPYPEDGRYDAAGMRYSEEGAYGDGEPYPGGYADGYADQAGYGGQEEIAGGPARTTLDEELAANIQQAEQQEKLAREMSRISQEGPVPEDVFTEHTKKYDIRRALPKAPEASPDEARVTDDDQPGGRSGSFEQEEALSGTAEVSGNGRGAAAFGAGQPASGASFSGNGSPSSGAAGQAPVSRFMVIETRTPEKGMEKAVERLKAYHLQNNSHNQTIKITGGKLNQRGVETVADRLYGKDLIVDEAGDLAGEELAKLRQLLADDESGMVVVLLDNPRQIDGLYQRYPEHLSIFERIDGEKEPAGAAANAARGAAGAMNAAPGTEAAGTADTAQKAGAVSAARPAGAAPETGAVYVVRLAGTDAQPEGSYGQPAGTDAQPERSYDQSAGIDAQSEGSYDQSAGTDAQPEGSYGQSAGADAQPEGAYGQSAGTGAQSEGAYGQPEGTYDRSEGNYAQPEGPYVPSEGAAEGPEGMEEIPATEERIPEVPVEERRDESYGIEMEPDDFAEYACQYASQIDCSITGKSMLALYERVELMEEDGVPLTKENAEAMIEEAADRAEKPSLGRMIKGLFSAKYNKEGLLILREEHFI